MKKVKQFIGFGVLAIALTAAFSYTSKKNVQITTTPATAVHEKPSNNTVKIALLLDTSNSMDGLINQAKAQLWDIVNKFSQAKCNSERPELQIALYQYGNDNLSSREGYVQQVLGFSDDLDEISEKLFSLTTNGGEEYCGEVIQTSLKQLEWGKNPDNLKMIFIAGNEPFNQGKLNYKDAVSNAKEKDVVVNTIFCGTYEQGINSDWKNGAYLAKRKSQSTEDYNAMALNESVAVKRAVSKSSQVYKNAKWDLVDAVEEEAEIISTISDKDLPNELKGKSNSEKEAYIKAKKTERVKLQKEIMETNKKREAYILENQEEGSKGELENAMLQAIIKQAEKKNYKWD